MYFLFNVQRYADSQMDKNTKTMQIRIQMSKPTTYPALGTKFIMLEYRRRIARIAQIPEQILAAKDVGSMQKENQAMKTAKVLGM